MSFCLVNCSRDDSEWSVSSDSNETEMPDIIYGKYIILENDRYVLNLSKEAALELGISENCYVKVLTDLEKSNAFVAKGIEHAKTDSNVTVVLSNPLGTDYEIQFPNGERIITYHDKAEVNNVRLKNGSEAEAGGWTLVTTKNLTLGSMTSTRSASGTITGATKLKFTFKGAQDVVGSLTITINSATHYYLTSDDQELVDEEISISGSTNWKAELTNGFSGTVKVYKK
jgi:hypothetical protein